MSNNMTPRRSASLLILLVTLLMVGTACLTAAPNLDSMSQTVTPMSAAVKQTITARALEAEGENDDLATAIVVATARSREIYATQTVRASLNDEAKLATATAIAPMVAELPRYGVDPSQGYVAWIHDPISIELNGYQQQGFANDHQEVTAKDFVLVSDITWNTKNSLSGCGFTFRSDGNQNKPNAYSVIITRTASGHLAFTATTDGQMSNFRTFFPKDNDKSFDWQNGATNRLAVVAKGPILEVYTNGQLVGTIDTSQPPPPNMMAASMPELPSGASNSQIEDYQNQIAQYGDSVDMINSQLATARKNFDKNKPILTEGLLGFLGMSQSGYMKCDFSNAWLFILDE
jgi:hypothetical protein